MLGALVSASSVVSFSSAAIAKPISDCIPVAKRAALGVIARTPAIGQMTIFGTPFAIEPHIVRVQVDVFGPQTFVYRVDVTIGPVCNVLATNAELENNPWPGR
jgi:hypothetical protein